MPQPSQSPTVPSSPMTCNRTESRPSGRVGVAIGAVFVGTGALVADRCDAAGRDVTASDDAVDGAPGGRALGVGFNGAVTHRAQQCWRRLHRHLTRADV